MCCCKHTILVTVDPSRVWTKRDGESLLIVNMESGHIAAALRFVVSHEGIRSERARHMLAVLVSRSE